MSTEGSTTPGNHPEHWHWREEPRPAGPTVVFDLDGVLSDASARQHFLRGPRPQWDAFFDACDTDSLLVHQVALGHLLAPHLIVVLLTARPLRVRPKTVEWLHRHPVRWDLLVMRPGGGSGPTGAFKAGVVDELRGLGHEVLLGFEDDPGNVEALRAAGVPTVYVHSGYYDRPAR